MTTKTPVVLCILDGWGLAEPTEFNAVAKADTPAFDRISKQYPSCQLRASEAAVGLPEGQPGNSEVGHMTIGSGRLIVQDLPRITESCRSGEIETLPPLVQLIQTLRKTGGSLHLTGLTSNGGVHAHSRHLIAIANIMAKADIGVWLHIITDGRDTLPKAALDELPVFLDELPENCQIASVTGRYFAMDRDERWQRTQAFLDVLLSAKAPYRAANPLDALHQAYARGETDEFIAPTCMEGYTGPKPEDGLFVANFRVDRIRQILRALATPAKTGCILPDSATGKAFGAGLFSMTPIADDLADYVTPLFMPPDLSNGLGEIVSKAGLTQIRIAESEKYPHVTFFFNGGQENAFTGEDRHLVDSPKVATYDLQPEMSSKGVLDGVLEAIKKGRHDLVIVNFANPDMVGHTGDMSAAVKAVECVDQALGQIVDAIKKSGGCMLVTADHGNCEVMWDMVANSPHTAHTTNLVPCVLVDHRTEATVHKLRNGTLVDLAPTILYLLGLTVSTEMTGRCLVDGGLA